MIIVNHSHPTLDVRRQAGEYKRPKVLTRIANIL
jgi:metallophosphoesterase superfamily enzyme